MHPHQLRHKMSETQKEQRISSLCCFANNNGGGGGSGKKHSFSSSFLSPPHQTLHSSLSTHTKLSQLEKQNNTLSLSLPPFLPIYAPSLRSNSNTPSPGPTLRSCAT